MDERVSEPRGLLDHQSDERDSLPVDDWLYATAGRWSPGMRDVENLTFLAEALGTAAPELQPVQFPYALMFRGWQSISAGTRRVWRRTAAVHGLILAGIQQSRASTACSSTSGPRWFRPRRKATAIAFEFASRTPARRRRSCSPRRRSSPLLELDRSCPGPARNARHGSPARFEPQQLDAGSLVGIPAGHDSRDDLAADHHRADLAMVNNFASRIS